MRTASTMGITTVAVFSDADATALHTRTADEAVHIGSSPAAESYLMGKKIIQAAMDTQADAIHPGYGFLSENADFAQAVIDAGLTWIGPKPQSIRAMGLKDAAKKRMAKAGVPVTPGYIGKDQSLEHLTKEAETIGYPVLIKAVAGGGGKGMRKVECAQSFPANLESCQREAKASFGNDKVLLEKWINSPRHIEVQIFGDSHGNIVHLFERDCSLQRRHQKVIEEAPAPGMDEDTRAEICAAAVRAAQAVEYEGAGTVEFIADTSSGLRADSIFFMEMNTRLQVEHPVTEEITGIDLVEWQLRIASGEPLPVPQEALSINGHAIEARLYAEDPAKGFLPSVGRLDQMLLDDTVARTDTGVARGDEISPFYDPMIAKIIVSEPTREMALEALRLTLDKSLIHPIETNKGFLFECLDSAEFCEGRFDTAMIERLGENLLPASEPGQETINLAGQRIFSDYTELQVPGDIKTARGLAGFRMNNQTKTTIDIWHKGQHFLAEVERSGSLSNEEISANGTFVTQRGKDWFFTSHLKGGLGQVVTDSDVILAPMPGKIISLEVSKGEKVTAGQRLMVLEAMKMEHSLIAPFDGTVMELKTTQGEQVQVEDLLCIIKPLG